MKIRFAWLVCVFAAALVGVGTLYNYFGGKGDLLVAVMAARTEEILLDTEACVPGHHEDPEAAVTDLLVAYVSGFLAFDPGLIRETISLAIAHPDRLGQRMLELDTRLIGQLSDLLIRLQTEGSTSATLDPAEASFALYAQAMTHLMLWTQTGPPEAGEMRRQVGRMVALLFRDWRVDVDHGGAR